MKVAIVLFAFLQTASFAEADVTKKCENPLNCFYYCQNGWAYDLDYWHLSCLNPKTGQQESSASFEECNSAVDSTRSYCRQP